MTTANMCRTPSGRPTALSPNWSGNTITKQNLSMLGGDTEKFVRTVSQGTTHVPDDFATSPLNKTTSTDWSTVNVLCVRNEVNSEPYKLVRSLSGLVEVDGALRDGPALTSDGRALELDGGRAMWFVHTQKSNNNEELKEETRMMRAARLAHAACEAEARISEDLILPVDAAGVVQSAAPTSAYDLFRDPARLKELFRKRRSAHRGQVSIEPYRLCVDPEGRVLLSLVIPGKSEVSRFHRWRLMQEYKENKVSKLSNYIIMLDKKGVIHFDPQVLVLDPLGVIRL